MESILIIKNILKKVNIHSILFFLAFASVITGLFKEFLVFSSIIIIHELGHIVSALIFKWNIKKINFYPFGGYIEFDEILNRPIKEELIIVISGLLFQTIYFILITIFYNNYIISERLFNLFKHYHYSILLFNLIPIYPLDGIKIVNLLLSKFIPYRLAHFISIIISIIFIIIFIVFSLINYLNMNFVLMTGLLFKQIINEKKNHKILFNKFVFERYLYNLKFNKTKILKNEKIKNMYRDKKHVFKINNEYITERKLLRKKYKKNWLNRLIMVELLLFVGPLTLQPHRKG